jgi:hypothetical protein
MSALITVRSWRNTHGQIRHRHPLPGGRVSFGLRAARGGRQDLGRLLPLALESPADGDLKETWPLFSEPGVVIHEGTGATTYPSFSIGNPPTHVENARQRGNPIERPSGGDLIGPRCRQKLAPSFLRPESVVSREWGLGVVKPLVVDRS